MKFNHPTAIIAILAAAAAVLPALVSTGCKREPAEGAAVTTPSQPGAPTSKEAIVKSLAQSRDPHQYMHH